MANSGIEWLNTNSHRNYPLCEDVTRIPTDSTGTVLTGMLLPNYLIVDFVMTTPGTQGTRLYLSQLAYVGNLLTFVISDQASIQVATLTVMLTSHVTNKAYSFIGNDTYSDAIGSMVLGDLSKLSNDLAEGLYYFTLASAEFETSTVRPALRAVRSLRTDNLGSESDYIYGHVKLLAGTNIQLTYLPAYNTIRIDAIDGGGLNDECDCGDEIGKDNVVRLINGLAIDEAEIVGDGQCVDVKVSGNRIVISDICSTPCCGCPELEFITQSLKTLEASIGNLESFAQQLSERISAFVTNYILTITG